MRKGSDVIGKVVVTYDAGKRVERVQDLIFDQNHNQLLGFLVEEKTLFRTAKVIPLQNVKAIGLDAIVVHSKGSVVGAEQISAIKEILQDNNVLRGTRILTTEGLDLGELVDLFFDEQSGLVEGYEVSGGLFADAYSGRSFVPAPETLKIGYDVAFVPPEIAQMMEEQVGGIRGAVQATGGRLQESAEFASRTLQSAAQSATEQIQSSAEDASQRIQAASQTAGQQLQSATDATSSKLRDLNRDAAASLTNRLVDPEEQKEYVLGKHVERDIVTTKGSVLLPQGQEVTLADVETADRLGILDELYRATGGSVTANISQALQEATKSTGDQIQRATQTGVANLQQSLAGLTARGAIDQAKGRRVLQTCRANDGLIIAASGQIVTEPVLARAQFYGKEAELLNAVGLTPATSARSTASDSWLETKAQLRDRTSIVQENLSSFWKALQEKAEGIRGHSARAIKQQRIEQALGRPVTRVILDSADNVLLNVGELITHRAIYQAEESGVLNILLNSVYTKEPEITEQELRASEHGIAALEHHNGGKLTPTGLVPTST
ncbi:MAG: PRC-barrel domain-containing protein [Kovacikia sp.]